MSKLSQWIRKVESRIRSKRYTNAFGGSDQHARRRELLAKKFADATRLGTPDIYRHAAPVDCSFLKFPASPNTGRSEKLPSSLCTHHQLDSAAFRYWAASIGESWRLHRKLWEFCFILQALYERNMLQEGKRGLGFAVGEEPLPAIMAKLGCEILASDLDIRDDRATVWAETAQLASTLEGLNARAICPPDAFQKRVHFRPIDMNKIPNDVRDYDFTWSSCSFEHCGSIGLGKRFLRKQMKCLKPGGIAVHTTEFNLSSIEETIDSGTTVIFRRQDVEAMVRDLQADGHTVETLQLDLGASREDAIIDCYPYSDNMHLKLELFDRYVSTSVALIIQKSHDPVPGDDRLHEN